MLTDEDLSRQLAGAFHGAGDELAYTGPIPAARCAPSAVWLGAPALAAAAAVVAVAAHAPSVPSHDGAATLPPTSVQNHATRWVTAKITAAGYTFEYKHAVGQPVPANDLYTNLAIDTVPSNATPVADQTPGATAWVGTDPSTGYNALYLEGAAINGGKPFVLLSPTWTQQQLSQLVVEDELDFPVPAVS